MPKSKTQVHLTPNRVFSLIEQKWGFKQSDFFDPCPENPKFDGLKIDWHQVNYVNPPFEVNTLTAFVEKAVAESEKFRTSIMLLPVKTDQDWFHDYIKDRILNPENIVWIRKRLKFRNNPYHAPAPHFLVRIVN